MSNMITSGKYQIYNMLYDNRYTSMAGPDNNYEVVGHDVPNTIEIEVTNEVLHLATLYDTKKGKYIHIDHEDRVVGKDEPQELQLSSEDGEKFVIHKQNINKVWILYDNGNWSPIYAASPPAEGVEGWTRKYWKFVTNLPGPEE